MADSKISGLSAITALTSTDELVVASSGASKKITAANLAASLPGFEIGYDQITSGVNVTGTAEATPTTIITCAAHTFDGAPVLAQFFSPQVAMPTGTNSTLGISLWEGSTELGAMGFKRTDLTAAQDYHVISAFYRFTPSAASHTYLLRAWVSVTTGTPSIGAGAGGVGANVPAFLRFTKV